MMLGRCKSSLVKLLAHRYTLLALDLRADVDAHEAFSARTLKLIVGFLIQLGHEF